MRNWRDWQGLAHPCSRCGIFRVTGKSGHEVYIGGGRMAFSGLGQIGWEKCRKRGWESRVEVTKWKH